MRPNWVQIAHMPRFDNFSALFLSTAPPPPPPHPTRTQCLFCLLLFSNHLPRTRTSFLITPLPFLSHFVCLVSHCFADDVFCEVNAHANTHTHAKDWVSIRSRADNHTENETRRSNGTFRAAVCEQRMAKRL